MGREKEDLCLWLKKHSQGRLKMKRGTDTLQDTAALGFDAVHRISIPTWKIHSGVKMQITKQGSFMSGVERESESKKRKREKIYIFFYPKCSSEENVVLNLAKKGGKTDTALLLSSKMQRNR